MSQDVELTEGRRRVKLPLELRTNRRVCGCGCVCFRASFGFHKRKTQRSFCIRFSVSWRKEQGQVEAWRRAELGIGWILHCLCLPGGFMICWTRG